MLGFHVVARLAQRYDIQVRLAATPGGGLTALVSLPRELVSDRPADAPPSSSSGLAGLDRYQRAAIAWSGDGRRPSLAGSTGPRAGRPTGDDVATPAPASAAATGPGSGSTAGVSALPERYPPSLAPAWLTSPMPPWYEPSIPAQSAPVDAANPFGSTSLLGATTPLGAQPTRLDARSLPLDAQPAGVDPGGLDPTPFDTSPIPLDAGSAPRGDTTPFDTPPIPLDAGSAPLDAQPAGVDPTAPLGAPPLPLGTQGAHFTTPPTPFDTPPTLPDATGAAAPQPAAGRAPSEPPDAGPARVIPRASGAAAQVHPGTRLGPVAAWVELQKSSAPAATPTPPPAGAAAPPDPQTIAWWAALVEQDTSTPVPRSSIWPTAAAGPPPLDVTSTPVPPNPLVETDPDGLARRVPGTHLAPALRRDAPGPPTDAERSRDVERVRAMLSRFQASQNAGRVAADPPRPRPPEENR